MCADVGLGTSTWGRPSSDRATSHYHPKHSSCSSECRARNGLFMLCCRILF